MKRNKKGFTLVELIIVIAVIGILAAILIPTFANAIEKANEKSARSDARNTVSQYVIDAVEEADIPNEVVIMVFKAGKCYLYGYDMNGSELLCSDFNDDPIKTTDTMYVINKHSYNGLVGSDVPTGDSYDITKQGAFYLYVHEELRSGIKGVAVSTIEGTGYMSIEPTEDVGENVFIFHGFLLPGTYKLDNTAGGTTTAPSTTTAPTAKPTESPTPALVTYTVKYDANGGTGSIADKEVTAGTKVNLPNCTFTAPAHQHFTGWKANNAGNTLAANAEYTVNSNVTFYAQWAEDTSYTVTYNANGGAGIVTDSTKYYANDTVTLKANGFTRGDYKFTGWKVNNEGKLMQAGETFTITGNTTVYAQWEPIPSGNEYTINITFRNGFSTQGTVVGNETYTGEFTVTNNTITITRLELLTKGKWLTPSTGGYYQGIGGIASLSIINEWEIAVTEGTYTYTLEIFVCAMAGDDPLLPTANAFSEPMYIGTKNQFALV